MEEQLEAEKAKSAALEEELKRLKRVVAVLTNLPMDAEGDAQ